MVNCRRILLPELAFAKGDVSATNHHITEPWQDGFQGVNQPFKLTKLKVEVKWPADAFGNFYRNGPALNEREGARLQYWFDCDGMRFSISTKGINNH